MGFNTFAPLRAWMHAHPLGLALGVGLLLRWVAAFSGYGWFAPDDYEFGVQQAGIWLHDPTAEFPCEFRSPLMSRLFWLLMWVPARAGITDREALLHWAYAGLGSLSAVVIWATYKLAAPLGQGAQNAAAWLSAAYALMPRICTRAMIEVVAMAPMVVGALYVQRARERQAPFAAGLWAGLGLGLATLLRFQMGVLFVAAAALFVADARRVRQRTAWTALAGLACGGALMALAQGCLDLVMHRPFLATPWRYVKFNLQHASSYGTSPWYTYLLHFVAFTLPPLTWFLWRPMWHALTRHSTAAVLLGTFVALHSCVGHKEDRFMFPMLPLFFIPLGAALAELRAGTRWQRRAAEAFVILNAVALAVTTFSDAHRNIATPLLEASRLPGARVATVGFGRVPAYYAGDASVQLFGDMASLQAAVGHEARFERILFNKPPTAEEWATVATLPGMQCSAPEPFAGDWVDRLLIRVNAHNAGRAPTALVRCIVVQAPAQAKR